MKAGWVTKPLGQVCDILDRLRKPITKRDRKAGPYPYYGATGILDHVENFLFDEPLVLIGEDGAKWGAGDNSAFSISGKTWVNNHAHVIRPHRNVVLDDWLIYYLNASDLSDFISGMTVPKLNQGRLKEITIPLPPLEEQKRIVAVLDEAFEGLSRARANADANLQNARELFESYLAEVASHHAEKYGTATVADLSDEVTDGDHMPPPKAETGIPFITISNVDKDTRQIDFSNTFKVPEAYYYALKDKRQPRCGDVLYTVTGSFGTHF